MSQTDEAGKPQHSYRLIRAIWPGDIVFHYSTRLRSIVGASVAGGPLEERPILWTPHGTSGKAKKKARSPVPGWWLPLYGFKSLPSGFALKSLHNPVDEAWVRNWVAEKQASITGPVEAPFQRYKGNHRGAQGYLAKMPLDFINGWNPLSQLANELGSLQESMTPLGDLYAPEKAHQAVLKLKSEEDYLAAIKAGVQRRTRTHERIVRIAAERLRSHNADPTTPHPIDLQINTPKKVIFEAKPIADRGPLFAIREAVGQLFEYRYFQGPQDAMVCVLLDGDPGGMLVDYLEQALGIGVCWLNGTELVGGPKTSEQLPDLQPSKAAAHAE